MLRDKDGQPKLFAGMISNLGKKNQIDHMTGLYNKYEFEENIKKYLADRKCMDTIGLMVLDMDSFKNINACLLYTSSTGERFTAKYNDDVSLSARVFKTIVDPFIGKYSLMKICTGTLKGDTIVYNVNKDTEEKMCIRDRSW